jgi:hypothetical protein
MNVAQYRNLVKKAMRNARKANRALDTQGEKVERRLDSLINRKTVPSGNEWQPLINDWNNYKKLITPVEKSLADMISISNV